MVRQLERQCVKNGLVEYEILVIRTVLGDRVFLHRIRFGTIRVGDVEARILKADTIALLQTPPDVGLVSQLVDDLKKEIGRAAPVVERVRRRARAARIVRQSRVGDERIRTDVVS